MNIVLYNSFEKKENSTKKPDNLTPHLTVSGDLREPCSMISPVFAIKRMNPDITPFPYTYAYIADFNRYYFVKDWSWRDGLWECRLEVDVLATYKLQIGTTSEYILRTDSTTDYNGEITDTTYPATTDVETETLSYTNVFTNDLTVGCYIVGIISGNQTQSVGAISYYLMTSAQFGALKHALFSDDNLEIMHIAERDITTGDLVPLITDMSLELLKTMYNPYQYIVSCMWYPFPENLIPNDKKHSENPIKIGWWDYPISGYRLYAQTIDVAEQPIQFIAHPQSATRGEYLNYEPYTKRTLVGRFGSVALDSFSFKINDTIDVMYAIDLITGQCRTKIGRMRNQNYDLLTDRQFLLGVPIQIAQVGTDYLGTAVSAINTLPSLTAGAIAGTASGTGAITGALLFGASGIYNTLQSAMPQVETSGSNGSFLSADYATHCITQFFKIVDEDITHRGRPLCEIRTINTLSGFVLCAEGDVDISCLDEERSMIKNYLTSGFFWE